MALASGTRLGPYEILAPLGAGGMGEVYRAKDTRLGRDVAIKVLPQHLSTNPEVRARFEREARTASGLNHPNICTLFDVGRDGETDYLVMELITGETLAHRLVKGALPTADVLRIGSEIADALDRAHRAGIVHRDLKPGNIMLTKSGAKLMDFGLARASGLAGQPGSGITAGAFTQSPTVAQPLTAEGTLIGTFQYMSPEQLEGKEADERSDVWALGCVLYEMATGKRAFEGKSQASLITSIMGSEPAPISQISPMTPPALNQLVSAMLAKDPADRLQSAHDVKLQLKWIAEGGSQAGIPKVVAKSRRNRERFAWLAAIALAVVAGVLSRDLGTRTAVQPVTRMIVPAPARARLQVTGDNAGPPAISPDGTMLVFTAIGGGGGKRLWLRPLDELAARPLPGTDDASYPFWSPDNRSVGFFASGKVRRLDLSTGTVVTIADAVMSARGGAWSESGVILIEADYGDPLSRVPDTGGTLQAVTVLDTTFETTHRFPQFLPDGKHFIYLSGNHTNLDDPRSGIYCGSLDGGRPVHVVQTRSSGVYANGFILFVRDSTLMAQEFDPDSRTIRGEPRATRETVHYDRSTWNAPVTASVNGVLVYGFGGSVGNNRVGIYDREGRRLRNITPSANILSINATPDARRVVIEWQQGPLADVWTVDVLTGTRSRLTTNEDDDNSPVWMPDGKNILYTGRARWREGRYSMFMVRADGSGEPRKILDDAVKDVYPLDVMFDGQWMLYGLGEAADKPQGALCIGRVSGTTTHQVLIPEADGVFSAQFSPDGKWIAFDASVSGRSEVYVSPRPANGEGLEARWQVSRAGGQRVRWRGDSRELYYMRLDGMIMAVAVDGSSSEFRLNGETPLFQAFTRNDVQTMDVSADGQTFVINALGGDEAEPMVVVSNWVQTLKAK